MSSASVAARWSTDLQSFSATAGNRGLDIFYARVVRPFLTIATMLEVIYSSIRKSEFKINLVHPLIIFPFGTDTKLDLQTVYKRFAM